MPKDPAPSAGRSSTGCGHSAQRRPERGAAIQYETFEHEADIGIRGSGSSIEEAFEAAALALYSVIINPEKVEQKQTRTVSVTAPDRELLLVEWLNSLLSLSDRERMVFSRFSVVVTDLSLTGTAWGEKLDRARHQPNVEVKGATYHLLAVAEENGIYTAQCVVDV